LVDQMGCQDVGKLGGGKLICRYRREEEQRRNFIKAQKTINWKSRCEVGAGAEPRRGGNLERWENLKVLMGGSEKREETWGTGSKGEMKNNFPFAGTF